MPSIVSCRWVDELIISVVWPSASPGSALLVAGATTCAGVDGAAAGALASPATSLLTESTIAPSNCMISSIPPIRGTGGCRGGLLFGCGCGSVVTSPAWDTILTVISSLNVTLRSPGNTSTSVGPLNGSSVRIILLPFRHVTLPHT